MDYFDRFSIFFSGDKLIAGRRTYPLGEITTELLNLGKAWFEKLQSAADNFVPAAREMLASKNEKAAPDVQVRLNAVWDLLLELPPYRDMDLDIKTSYHLFSLLVSDSEKWQEATTAGTEGCKRTEWLLDTIDGLSQNLLAFLNQVDATLTLYFEPLGKRKSLRDPAQREYRKAYNRLKVRKNRKKISNDEWNEKIAQAQEWKGLAEQGKLSDSDLREKLASL